MVKKSLLKGAAEFVKLAAHERDWFLLAGMLQDAQLSPQEHGFANADDVIAAVAEARRQHPGALRGPITARRFLEQEYGIQGDEVHCGFSQVEILRSIRMVDPQYAREILRDVLNGVFTTKALRAIKNEVISSVASDTDSRSPSLHRKRAAAFEDAVKKFVQENPHLLNIAPGAQISDALLPPFVNADLVVFENEKPIMVVEAKRGSPNAYRRQLHEAVGLCALALKRVPQVWVISPLSARKQLETMARIAEQFDLKGSHFACLDDALAQKDPEKALQLIEPVAAR